MEKATLLTLGVLLFLVGLIGHVRAKELDIGTHNPIVRVIVGIMGAVFIAIALREDMAAVFEGPARGPSRVSASAPAPTKPSLPNPAPPDRIRDRIDYPFVDDPSAVGAWRAVDFVPQPDAFAPGQRRWSGQLEFTELHILPGGKTSLAWRWTKGMLLHDNDETASLYEIRTLQGRDYLFFQWKSGDYTIRHRPPSWYVLTRGP